MTAQVLFSMFFSQKDPGLNAVEEFDQIIKRFKKKDQWRDTFKNFGDTKKHGGKSIYLDSQFYKVVLL